MEKKQEGERRRRKKGSDVKRRMLFFSSIYPISSIISHSQYWELDSNKRSWHYSRGNLGFTFGLN